MKLFKLKTRNKTLLLSFLLVLVLGGVFLFTPQVHAIGSGWLVSKIVVFFGNLIMSAVGKILAIVMNVFVYVAQYNNFIDATAVEKGWVIVRDLCNMFFVVILLIIAFATILNQEAYNYKKLLPRLILMAVLINFSKTICGILIDIAQVIMLTFVNQFKSIAGPNLVNMLGLEEIKEIKEESGGDNTQYWDLALAYILGSLYIIIAFITVTAMLLMLVFRIVMIWVYVILSPLAYLLSAFPAGKGYASQWWSEFSKQLVVGPVLAFFIWLSFATVTMDTTEKEDVLEMNESAQEYQETSGEATTTAAAKNEGSIPSKAASSDTMVKFVVSIAMLMGGLMIAQKAGGAVGSIAGQAYGSANKVLKSPLNAGKRGAQSLGRGVKKEAGYQAKKARLNVGNRLGLNTSDKIGKKIKEKRQSKISSLENKNRKIATQQEGYGKTGVGRAAAKFSQGKGVVESMKAMKGGQGSTISKKQKELKNLKQKRKEVYKEEEVENYKKKKVDPLQQKKEQIDQQFEEQQGKVTRMFSEGKKDTDEYKQEVDKRDQLKQEQKSIGEQLSEAQEKHKTMKNNQEGEDKEATNLDEQIKQKEEEVKQSEQKVAGSNAELESLNAKEEKEEKQKIEQVDNTDELVNKFKQAIKEGNFGLASASAKKISKNGDYDKLMKAMGKGTGREGLQDFTKNTLEKEGGFDSHSAKSLTSEIGQLAKNNGDYQAYAPYKMENGSWKETDEVEQQTAVLSTLDKKSPSKILQEAGANGVGEYKSGEHTPENSTLNVSSLELFASKDKQFAEAAEKSGNREIVNFIGSNEKNIQKLEQYGATEFANKIKELKNKQKSQNQSLEEDIEEGLEKIERKFGGKQKEENQSQEGENQNQDDQQNNRQQDNTQSKARKEQRREDMNNPNQKDTPPDSNE